MNKKQIFASVAVIFDNKGRVLLAKRNNPKNVNQHGKLHLPGGSIEFGEHPVEALKREIKEEINIEIEVLTKDPYVWSKVFDERKHVLLLAYAAKYISGEINTNQDKETMNARWYNCEEIDFSNCFENTKELIEISRKYF